MDPLGAGDAEGWDLPFGGGDSDSDSDGGVEAASGGSLAQAGGPSRALGGGRDCERCLRPLRTCLCPHLPAAPLATRTTVVVLQHPAEKKRRLQTARLARLVIGGPGAPGTFHLLQGRRVMRAAHDHLLPATFWEDLERGRVLVLFPGAAAASLERYAASSDAAELEDCDAAPAPAPAPAREEAPAGDRRPLTLLVIDGTWRQAKEMFRELQANENLGPKLRQVSFPEPEPERDAGAEDQPLLPSRGALRKQPAKGCVTTLEAIAFALFYLEQQGPGGQAHAEAVRAALLRPVEAMVEMQVKHGASAAARTYGEDSKLAKTLFVPGP